MPASGQGPVGADVQQGALPLPRKALPPLSARRKTPEQGNPSARA